MPSLTEAQARIVARLRAGEELRYWTDDGSWALGISKHRFIPDANRRVCNNLLEKGVVRLEPKPEHDYQVAVLVGEPEEREGR
jgi:hypothetical protein